MGDCKKCRNYSECKFLIKDTDARCPFIYPMQTKEYDKGYSDGYVKAIDEFAERLSYKIKSEIDDCADELDWIDEIAEEMRGAE